MKKFLLTSILALLVASGTTVIAQNYPDEYLGLPGDNLNLYAVMKLFQESETLEGFERSLNDENSRINNLDLNGDNFVDYITVVDFVDRDVHSIVLRAALNKNEYQDIAVFTVQRFRDGSVQIQLVGDEALYGRNYIIEPIYDETPNPGYTGRQGNVVNVTVVRTTPFEVAVWPLVRFIYLPDYVIWRSSWYWGYYPAFWHPWQPFYWDYYYGYHYNWYHHYYRHYHHWQQLRYERYNDFYYSSNRFHSPIVAAKINEGNYKSTYSHPEQRRDGEALFTKMHPDQGKRTQEDDMIASQARRSVPQTSGERTTAGTSKANTRRSDNTANGRQVTKSSSGQSTGATRRSETTVKERPVIKSSDQNTSANRRFPSTRPERVASKPEPAQKKEVARESRSSASSSGNKKSSEIKARTSSGRSEKSKTSEDQKTTKRR
jgi:hypothetical protein